MDTTHRDNLVDIIDSKLSFQWMPEGYQSSVFDICCFFQFTDDHILPFFLNSLLPEYTWFSDKYNYLQLLYTMAEARYDVLASFLLSYLNKHSYSFFIPPFVLFRARSLNDFISAVHSLSNQKNKRKTQLFILVISL